MLETELQKIGLSEKEAKVYLAALELGPSPVQKIASKAKVNRATTYVILEGLMKKGIITTFDQGKKRLFVAEGPHALKNVIHHQQEELDKKEQMLEGLFSQLQSVHNTLPNKPVVRFFDGKEGLKSMLEELLESKTTQARVVYPTHAVANLFNEEERKDYRERRVKKGIKIKSIYSDRGLDQMKNPLSDRKRVPEEKFSFTSEIEIWEDKVIFAALEGQVSGVMIQSQAMAQTMRTLFDMAFESAEKYDLEFKKTLVNPDKNSQTVHEGM
jgi:sugar-specific transcriptional regulator TrmB